MQKTLHESSYCSCSCIQVGYHHQFLQVRLKTNVVYNAITELSLSGKSMRILRVEIAIRAIQMASPRRLAHSGLYGNPGDLTVAAETCGACHEEIVSVVKKSLHATSAGVISGSRYLWAAQKEKNARYAIRPVTDEDGDVPEELGTVKTLQALPYYKDSNQPIDDYLRNQCLRCHLWTRGAQRHGGYRASGCSACHVLYADDGTPFRADGTKQ